MIERKDRSHIFISTCTKAVFDKVQHSLTKVLETLEIDKAYLRILKPICSNLISNIILNKEKLRTFPVKSGTRLGCPLSLLSIQYGAPSLKLQQ